MKKFSFFAPMVIGALVASSAQAEEIAGRCTCPNGGELVFFTGESPVKVDCEKSCAALPAHLRDGQEIMVEQKARIRVPELDITARCVGSPDPAACVQGGGTAAGGGGFPCWFWPLLGGLVGGLALGGLGGWLIWGRRRPCPDPAAHSHTCPPAPPACLNPELHLITPEERARRHDLAADYRGAISRYGEAKRDGRTVDAGHWWRAAVRILHRLYATMGKAVDPEDLATLGTLPAVADVVTMVRCDDTDMWRRSERREGAPEPTPPAPEPSAR